MKPERNLKTGRYTFPSCQLGLVSDLNDDRVFQYLRNWGNTIFDRKKYYPEILTFYVFT